MAHAIDPTTWTDPALRRALARRDVPAVYRLLTAVGVTQRRLAELTGQAQSEVSEVLHGRQVQSYDVLARIADGLGVPRGWMGLAYDGGTPTPEREEVDEDMKRRNFLAVVGSIVFGKAVFGEPEPLTLDEVVARFPQRVGMSDVRRLADTNARLRVLDRQIGGHAVREMAAATARGGEELLKAQADDHVRAQLQREVAATHQIAGWAAGDVGLVDHCRWHTTRALEHVKGDGERTAEVLAAAGHMEKDHATANEGLKLFQLAQIAADRSPDPQVHAVLAGSMAAAYRELGHADDARAQLRIARERFAEADPDRSLPFFAFYGPGYGLMAATEIKLGDLDAAHEDVTGALAARPAYDVRCNAMDTTVLATVLLNAGEVAEGVREAQRALMLAAEVGSRRVLDRLEPMERALAARRSSTAQDLARRTAAVRATA